MALERSAGILLHPTSLPSRGGIGDFGPATYDFIEFLAAARQGVWQVLPLNPLGMGNSPYSSTSAFAGNPLLISLERLGDRGWLDRGRVERLADRDGNINYEEARALKMPLLHEAAENFLRHGRAEDRARYDTFRSETSWWLEDFVLFDALKQHHNGEAWNRWPSELAHRQPEALD